MQLLTSFPSENICCRDEDGREESFGCHVQNPNRKMRLNYNEKNNEKSFKIINARKNCGSYS